MIPPRLPIVNTIPEALARTVGVAELFTACQGISIEFIEQSPVVSGNWKDAPRLAKEEGKRRCRWRRGRGRRI